MCGGRGGNGARDEGARGDGARDDGVRERGCEGEGATGRALSSIPVYRYRTCARPQHFWSYPRMQPFIFLMFLLFA